MLFVLNAIDRKDSLATRLATREAHFAYIRQTSAVRLGGPLLDASGDMAGSLIIFEAADLDAAKAWAANDPYAKAGLFESANVTAWKATANFCEAKF